MKFYGHGYKTARVGTFYVAAIRGESCFEKNAFRVTENPHSPTKTRLPVKEYLGKYSRHRKKLFFVLKLLIRPILFHGKISFDNLTYFKLYGNLDKVNKPEDKEQESVHLLKLESRLRLIKFICLTLR